MCSPVTRHERVGWLFVAGVRCGKQTVGATKKEVIKAKSETGDRGPKKPPELKLINYYY